jgi:hypothetical protein
VDFDDNGNVVSARIIAAEHGLLRGGGIGAWVEAMSDASRSSTP